MRNSRSLAIGATLVLLAVASPPFAAPALALFGAKKTIGQQVLHAIDKSERRERRQEDLDRSRDAVQDASDAPQEAQPGVTPAATVAAEPEPPMAWPKWGPLLVILFVGLPFSALIWLARRKFVETVDDFGRKLRGLPPESPTQVNLRGLASRMRSVDEPVGPDMAKVEREIAAMGTRASEPRGSFGRRSA